VGVSSGWRVLSISSRRITSSALLHLPALALIYSVACALQLSCVGYLVAVGHEDRQQQQREAHPEGACRNQP
jgi:hypothetical protein